MRSENMNPPQLNEDQLNQIEENSVKEFYRSVQKDLKNEPQKFHNFRALKYIEFNARVLAHEYQSRKENCAANEELMGMAKKCLDNAQHRHNIIKKIIKKGAIPTNPYEVETLLSIIDQCLTESYHLANHRKSSRMNAFMQRVDDRTLRIEQKINVISERVASNNIIQAEAALFSIAPPPPPADAAFPVFILPPPPPPPPANIDQQQMPGPLWMVSLPVCNYIKQSNPTMEKFVREYLGNLFSKCELLLPWQHIPNEKKAELLAVVMHFYGNDEFETTLKSVATRLRNKNRHEIFKKIDNSKGFGISNLGVEFFYDLGALPDQLMCYRKNTLCPQSRLITKQVGEFKIPENCGAFEFILFIEKRNYHATFKTLLPDGTIVPIYNYV